MSFVDPHAFWLLSLLLLLLSNKSISLNTPKVGLILSFISLVFALARPVIEQEPLKNDHFLSDVVIAIDLSYSMQATDITPSRLQKAQEYLQELIKQNQTNRYAVVGFTSNALVLSPLTQDSELLLHLFRSLDTSLITTKGSSIMPALKLARKISKAKNLSVVLLSDGGDAQEYHKEALYAQENHLRVNILMLASIAGASLKQKDGTLLSDVEGAIVVSRENRAIEVISDATGGVYSKDLQTIMSALASQREDLYKTQMSVEQNRELYYIFVVMALVLFVVSVTKFKVYLKKLFVPFILLFGGGLDASVFEYLYEQNAQTAYKAQEYARAVDLYKKVQTDDAYYNLGCAYYKLGAYEKALASFARVRSASREFKAQVFYNQANTLVRLKEFEQAREAYLKSLSLVYTLEADENLAFIKDVAQQQSMNKDQKKSDPKSHSAQKEQNAHKQKEGGGSNMQVKTDAKSGASDGGKKAKVEALFNQNSSKTKLSSSQYELINKRGVNETKPW